MTTNNRRIGAVLTTNPRCNVARCRHTGALTYLRKWVCDYHWDRLAGDRKRLTLALGLPYEPDEWHPTDDLDDRHDLEDALVEHEPWRGEA